MEGQNGTHGAEVAQEQVVRLCQEAQECMVIGRWFDLASLILTSADLAFSKVAEKVYVRLHTFMVQVGGKIPMMAYIAKQFMLAVFVPAGCPFQVRNLQADVISGFHSNTHIPIVIGAQMRYEITGDELYKEIGTFCLDVVNSTHSFATGGTSESEFWHDPKRLGD